MSERPELAFGSSVRPPKELLPWTGFHGVCMCKLVKLSINGGDRDKQENVLTALNPCIFTRATCAFSNRTSTTKTSSFKRYRILMFEFPEFSRKINERKKTLQNLFCGSLGATFCFSSEINLLKKKSQKSRRKKPFDPFPCSCTFL